MALWWACNCWDTHYCSTAAALYVSVLAHSQLQSRHSWDAKCDSESMHRDIDELYGSLKHASVVHCDAECKARYLPAEMLVSMTLRLFIKSSAWFFMICSSRQKHARMEVDRIRLEDACFLKAASRPTIVCFVSAFSASYATRWGKTRTKSSFLAAPESDLKRSFATTKTTAYQFCLKMLDVLSQLCKAPTRSLNFLAEQWISVMPDQHYRGPWEF